MPKYTHKNNLNMPIDDVMRKNCNKFLLKILGNFIPKMT